ncbi:hypothetical protein LTH96_06735 [Nesterenkonia sp. LB17]|uniref:ATP-binding protein n=1 Tax=Nesterenkonia sp. LB17 TaxID=2901230 RepID=UPI001F4D10E9|nr:hypothetical protein [Nesterenkonia sp. LB17]MCH8565415.1 hypothetical protein [Nesterenkonia sp. LB17]
MKNAATEKFIQENFAGMAPRDYGDRPAYGPKNLFAQAARRAKIHVSAVGQRQVFTYDGRTVGGAEGFLTSLTSVGGERASFDRKLARRYLSLAGIPIPEGQVFSTAERDAAQGYAAQMTGPVAIKPRFGESGLGVSLQVDPAVTFGDAWSHAEQYDFPNATGHGGVVVERFHDGLNLRAYVVDEEVVAAVIRVPLFGLGDGRSTLSDLAQEADRGRKRNPLLAKFELETALMPRAEAKASDPISNVDRIYWFSPGVNMRLGGLTVDVTDRLDKSLKTLAVDARWAVPGSPVAGVDILAPSLDSAVDATVLEVDAQASFSIHHYPWSGNGRRVADKVLARMTRD